MLTDPDSVPVQMLGRLNSVRSLSPVHESNVHSATTLSPEMWVMYCKASSDYLPEIKQNARYSIRIRLK